MIDLKSGDIFAGCKIINICGKGGYGAVYLAEDPTGKTVAVKLVNTNNKERELIGIRNYMPVSHRSPYLLPVYHVGIERDELYLVMHAASSLAGSHVYLPDTLGRRLQFTGKLPPAETLDIIRKLASAVKTLHDAGLIHRDIKPDNVIFADGRPMLSDPGLICSTDATITLAGTLGFLPPECFSGAESNSMQSDIYALGKLFYCIITGEPPGRFPYLPRDLSFPLCRKLLPILLKACNSKKKKRYNTIEEFQKELPAKLPNPGFLLQLSEKFRIWRLMHCRLYYSILALLMVVVLSGAWLFHRHLAKQEQQRILTAQLILERRFFEQKIRSRSTMLEYQLEKHSGKDEAARLIRKYTVLPADTAKAAELCRKYSCQLNKIATDTAEKNLEIKDDLKRLTAKHTLLNAPLGSFLSAEQRKVLSRDFQREVKQYRKRLGGTPVPGSTFYPESARIFEFAYIPPGSFISPNRKKKINIDYPFWVAPTELSLRQFSRICRYLPPHSGELVKPAVEFLWNDLLFGCLNAFNNFSSTNVIPEGYIVRPLTVEEWEYCAIAGMTKPAGRATGKDRGLKRAGSGTPNRFGLYNLEDNVSEIVWEEEDVRPNSISIMGSSYLTGKYELTRKRDVVYYQSFLRYVGTRLAIAPGKPEFYRNALQKSSPQHFVHNGKHYEFFGHIAASFSRKNSEKICRLLGGKLASLDSPELVQKTYKNATPVINYGICVAADFKNGKWYWESGKEVLNPPPPPEKNKIFSLVDNKFKLEQKKSYLGFVCVWTQKEWEDRFNWKKRIPDSLKYKIFDANGKSYLVLRLNAYPHLCSRFAEIIGGKIAEPEDKASRMMIAEKMESFAETPSMLGGFWQNGALFWATSKRQITEALERKGMIIDTAPSLQVPAMLNGELCVTQLPQQFIVEFPANSSNHQ